MDLLSRIAAWLGENEATISAVVGITATGRGPSFSCNAQALDVIETGHGLGACCSYPLRDSGLKE